MNLDSEKEIKKEIRRAQVDKAYHQREMQYYEDQIKILNYALTDLRLENREKNNER
jgi:hypothetical protein